MSFGPERRFTVALSLALSVVSIACGSESETSSPDAVVEKAGTKAPYSGSTPTTSCTPSVALGDPVAQPLPSFTCPSGWDSRSKSNALLVAGRFSTAREMVDALCTESSEPAASTGDPAGIGIEIDFDANDVIAVAHDGEVGIHRRGGELWIRHTETCERSYRTALFVVPKRVEPLEQTCSMPCQ